MALVVNVALKKTEPAANAIEQTIDAHFPDARMEKIYPNAKAIN